MKTIIGIVTVIAAILISTGASADNGQGTVDPHDNGNQGCVLLRSNAADLVFANPGALFQFNRNDVLPDTNPKSTVDLYHPNGVQTVGQYVADRCGRTPPN